MELIILLVANLILGIVNVVLTIINIFNTNTLVSGTLDELINIEINEFNEELRDYFKGDF